MRVADPIHLILILFIIYDYNSLFDDT
jgi:hypothetical protein